MIAPGADGPAGLAGADIQSWVPALNELPDAGDDPGRIDQIRLLEDIKSACAAAQARITSSFAESQRSVNAARLDDAGGEDGAGGGANRRTDSASASNSAPDSDPDVTADRARHADADTAEMRAGTGGSRAQRAAQRRAKAERLAARSAAAQVALARRESPQRGGRFVGLADALTQEMPNTLAALAAGVVNEWRAMVIVRETACLTADQRRQVDAEIAGRLDGLGDARVRALVTALVYRLDPEAATERSVRAASDRRVSVRPAPDAMAYLTGLMPIAAAIACHAALCRYVDSRPAAEGDTRTRDQRIVDEFVARLTGTSDAGSVGSGTVQPTGVSAGVGVADGSPGYCDDIVVAGGGGDGFGEPDGIGGSDGIGGGEGFGDPDGIGDGDEVGGGADGVDADDRVVAGIVDHDSDDGDREKVDRTESGGDDRPSTPEPMTTDVTVFDPVSAVRAAYERAVSQHPSPPGRPHERSARPDPSRPDRLPPHPLPPASPPGPGRMPADACGIPPGTDVILNVVITDRALLAGGDDPAILPGNYPIPAPLVRRMLTDLPPKARVWIRRLYTRPDTGELVAQDSRRREFSPAMRRLLLTRDQTCRTPWCNAIGRHADHLRPAAAGGATSIANGQALSEDCNYIRTAPGWSAERASDGSGDIVVTAPTGHRYRSPCPDVVPWHARAAQPPVDVCDRAERLLEWSLARAG